MLSALRSWGVQPRVRVEQLCSCAVRGSAWLTAVHCLQRYFLERTEARAMVRMHRLMMPWCPCPGVLAPYLISDPLLDEAERVRCAEESFTPIR